MSTSALQLMVVILYEAIQRMNAVPMANKSFADLREDNSAESPRIFYGGMAQIIESIPFLPITINVPDLIYGFGDMMAGVYNYFFGSEQSTTPRFWNYLLTEMDKAILY